MVDIQLIYGLDAVPGVRCRSPSRKLGDSKWDPSPHFFNIKKLLLDYLQGIFENIHAVKGDKALHISKVILGAASRLA